MTHVHEKTETVKANDTRLKIDEPLKTDLMISENQLLLHSKIISDNFHVIILFVFSFINTLCLLKTISKKYLH